MEKNLQALIFVARNFAVVLGIINQVFYLHTQLISNFLFPLSPMFEVLQDRELFLLNSVSMRVCNLDLRSRWNIVKVFAPQFTM